MDAANAPTRSSGCAIMGGARCLGGEPLNLGETAGSASVFNGIAFCYEL
jgi:hypothetical protein